MLYALDVSGTKTRATPGGRGVCPHCRMPVLAKTGEINAWHWAHVAGTECDSWAEGETDWHLGWKSHWPANLVEVTLNRDDVLHRADIITPAHVVIELQHSPIAPQQVHERETFYRNMVWIFDVSEPVNQERLWVNKRPDYYTFHWLHPRKTVVQVKTTSYWDFGNGWLFRPIKTYDIGGRGWGQIMQKTDFILRHGGVL